MTHEELSKSFNPRVLASNELQKERLNVCNTCEHNEETFKVNVCKKCGCIVRTKVAFKRAKCPIGNW